MEVGNLNKVETPEVTIKGNIMTWNDTMLQLSNVSSISTVQEKPKFPIISILLIILGIVFISLDFLPLVCLLVLFTGIIILVFYIEFNRDNESLIITMNSGSHYKLLVSDKAFMTKMLAVLEKIIRDGGVGNRSITIDIKNSTIGDFSALNDTEIR